VLSRTSGLLGFVERSTTNDAVVAITAAVVAVVTLLPVAVQAFRQSGQATDSAAPASSASA